MKSAAYYTVAKLFAEIDFVLTCQKMEQAIEKYPNGPFKKTDRVSYVDMRRKSFTGNETAISLGVKENSKNAEIFLKTIQESLGIEIRPADKLTDVASRLYNKQRNEQIQTMRAQAAKWSIGVEDIFPPHADSIH